MSYALQICKNFCKTKTIYVPRRSLFKWVYLQFNALDEDRRKKLGADRTCAEWILRNGGKVKFVNRDEEEADYNNLPEEDVQVRLQEINASGTSIMAEGFIHLEGCKSIDKLILHECQYLEDNALNELNFISNSLLFLQVSRCPNISDNGLLYLTHLKNLRHLIIFGLTYVRDKPKVLKTLQDELKQCQIKFD
ncbi:ATP synthase subunit s, mitochondrial [Cylas formicarius]|uniref:ATP synthase subunit s, mitochondrial n=1 Tax=Cylas formicarius TaxID=197179 RepID=UPI002958CAA0|nr:ATP synthase subunit s, mitochondrial [Cylas formicarius]